MSPLTAFALGACLIAVFYWLSYRSSHQRLKQQAEEIAALQALLDGNLFRLEVTQDFDYDYVRLHYLKGLTTITGLPCITDQLSPRSQVRVRQLILEYLERVSIRYRDTPNDVEITALVNLVRRQLDTMLKPKVS